MKKIIIVGAGLFGSIAARLARSLGHEVTVIDSGEAWAASKASGCVLAPSWLSALDSEQIDTAMDTLGALFDVQQVDFKTNLLKTFRAHRVDPRQVLLKPDLKLRVDAVHDGAVDLSDGTVLKGTVLVAAGMGCAALLPGMPAMRGLWGASLWYKGAQIDAPRINVYAPYRQAVAYNLDKNTVWMGDGTALVEKTWKASEAARVQNTQYRAKGLFKLKGDPVVTVGARPYVEGFKQGYFVQVFPRTWVSTGGAKNGTVLAAYQAARFIQEAKL